MKLLAFTLGAALIGGCRPTTSRPPDPTDAQIVDAAWKAFRPYAKSCCDDRRNYRFTIERFEGRVAIDVLPSDRWKNTPIFFAPVRTGRVGFRYPSMELIGLRPDIR